MLGEFINRLVKNKNKVVSIMDVVKTSTKAEKTSVLDSSFRSLYSAKCFIIELFSPNIVKAERTV